MKFRHTFSALGLALGFVLLHVAAAKAEYRGTDLWSNLALGDHGSNAFDKYPLSYFQLDYHVDVGITNPAGVAPMIAQFFAGMLFLAETWLMRTTISIFDWAFNLDIIGGSGGALKPISIATQSFYYTTVLPLMAAAFIGFGIWVGYKALKRQHAETGSGIVRVIVLTTIALVLIYKPYDTIGRAFQYPNELSSAVVSGGQGSDNAPDRLFDVFVYKPWAVLQFGGLKVCTGAKQDSDGFPMAATTRNPAKVCHPVLHKGADGHGDYANRFLAYAPGSKARDDEYKALNHGEAPDTLQFDGIKIDKTDAPAVDMMQAGGATQRLALTGVLALGTFGAVLLLGLLSCASLFAQLALLVLFGLTPVMVLIAALPGAHGIFWSWARLIGYAIIAKLVYSVLLGIALKVSEATIMVFGDAHFFFAFLLQSLLFIGLIVCRKSMAGMFMSRHAYHRSESSAKNFVTTAAATSVGTIASPIAAAGRAGDAARNRAWQQPAAKPSGGNQTGQTTSNPDSVSPPASAGREYSSAPPDHPPKNYARSDANPSTTVAMLPAQAVNGGENPVPTFKQDLEQERARRAEAQPEQKIVSASAYQKQQAGVARPDNLTNDLEHARERRAQERAKAPGK